MNTSAWEFKYKPTGWDNYIPSNPILVDKLKEYIEQKDFPHLLLYSKSPGSGKSSDINILLKNI